MKPDIHYRHEKDCICADCAFERTLIEMDRECFAWAEPIDSLGIVERMELEAVQFAKCSRQHDRNGNHGAAAVADRARLRLLQFATEIREENQ